MPITTLLFNNIIIIMPLETIVCSSVHVHKYGSVDNFYFNFHDTYILSCLHIRVDI